MRLDVRTAALDDTTEQRVRLAASLLGAYRVNLRLGLWDGTRCDLLIAAADDAYGMRALELARRRGTPVIAVGRSSDATIRPDATASSLAQHMRERIQPAVPPDAALPEAAALPTVCRLAQPPLRGSAVDILCHGRVLKLRPQTGRACPASHSDLLAVADNLHEPCCRIVAVEGADDVRNLFSASLESVLLRGIHRLGERVPPFPEGRYWLDAWPDLGMLPSLTGALPVSLRLIGNTKSIGELIGDLRDSTLGEAASSDLHACLWAFAAADLLRAGDSGDRIAMCPPRKQRAHVAFLSSLTRRFGLRRA